jgi:hypothetical protein
MDFGLTGFSIMTLAIDPITPTTLYAGTYGDGVYKSVDAGANWYSSTSIKKVRSQITSQ